MNILPLGPAAVLLPLLLYFETRKPSPGLLPTKGMLSLLFIVTALIQPHHLPVYFGWMLAGLICCFAGDILLALPQRRAFLFGLVAFLIGHVCYVAAFWGLMRWNLMTLLGSAVAVAAGVAVYRWLKPHLGRMHLPVVCYMVVISGMLIGACSLFGNGTLAFDGRAAVGVGAICFYISDLFVARDRFVTTVALNRMIGLPLYYVGQFLLALSIALLHKV